MQILKYLDRFIFFFVILFTAIRGRAFYDFYAFYAGLVQAFDSLDS